MLTQQSKDVCMGPDCDHRHGEVTQFVKVFTDYSLEELRDVHRLAAVLQLLGDEGHVTPTS